MNASTKRHQFFDLRYPATDLPVFLDELGSQLVIEAVVYSGNGVSAIVPLPGESLEDHPVCHTVSWTSVEDWIGILQATDDPQIFELDPSGAVKAVHRKAQRAVGAAVQWAVYRRDNYRCVYCSRAGGEDGVALSVDHFVAVEAGGTDEMSNLLTACRRCNKDKGSRSAEDYAGPQKASELRGYLGL